MTSLLMPKATAVWLIDNTTLTFEQIAEFCSLHVLEVQAIADGDVGQGILGFDPILNGQLTQEEIDKCCNDTSLFLTKSNSSLPETKNKLDLLNYNFLHKRNLLFGTPEYVVNKIKELQTELNLQNLQVWSNFGLGM